jgi:chromate transporter
VNGSPPADAPHQPQYAEVSASLGQLIRFFLWLGVVAFGGPVAHIGLMEREVVERRRWVTREHFLDLIGVTNLLPGPNSTEMTMHVGYVQRGVRGVCVAGVGFIVPAAALTLAISWAYVEYGELPAVRDVLAGIYPVVLALVGAALVKLARQALDHPVTWAVAVTALAAALLGIDELVVLAAGAVIGLAAFYRPTGGALLVLPLWLQGGTARDPPTLGRLGLLFLRFGATIFGSGYLLVAYLDSVLVDQLGWLEPDQLIATVAIGEITPGPLFSASTSVGYLVLGVPGALVATVAMFLPAFVIAMVVGRFMPALERVAWARPLLRGLVAAVVGVMAAVSIQLGQRVITSWVAAVIGVVALVVVLRTRVSGLVLIPLGGVLGYLAGMAGWV